MKQLSFFTAFLFTTIQIFAQDRPFRQYATQEVHKRLLSENPGMEANLAVMEGHIDKFGQSVSSDTIAIVFHVLIGPDGAGITENDVQMQLDMLNRDFGLYEQRKKEYPDDRVNTFADMGIDMGIFFCLADESNHPIRFIDVEENEWGTDDALKYSEQGGADAYKPENFLNIWVAGLGDRKSGYAQLPGGPIETDGIVIDRSYFAGGDEEVRAYYGQGVTLTHLVGSYLWLYELWDETAPCGDDKVGDTPIHNAPNFGIGTNHFHISTCTENHDVEMIINFMDNTDDEALTMFTQGQKQRVKANLSEGGARHGITISPNVCRGDDIEDRSADMGGEERPTAPFGNRVSVFPNPAQDEVTVNIQAVEPGAAKLTVFNAQGAVVVNTGRILDIGGQHFNLDCSNWAAGVYYVKVLFKDGSSVSQNLSIER